MKPPWRTCRQEEIIFDEISTGAGDDLSKVTKVARRMITEFGMSEKLGPITFGHKHGAVFLGRDLFKDRNYSEKIAYQIDQEVFRMVDKCHRDVRRILGRPQRQSLK